MVVDGTASLVIQSTSRSVAEITALLQITPTRAGDRGDPIRVHQSGVGAGRRNETTVWTLECEPPNPESGDDDGVASLSALVAALVGKEAILAELRGVGCTTTVWWYGCSDSEQGGFVLSTELLRELAGLGCDLFGSVYLEVPAEDSDGPR